MRIQRRTHIRRTHITAGLMAGLLLSLPARSTAQAIAGYVIPGVGEYVNTNGSNAAPGGITMGSDGALWFTEFAAYEIGRVTSATRFSQNPYSQSGESCPYSIVAGPDGALWFADSCANQIGRMTTAGAYTKYAVPTANAGPQQIAVGPDGALWFTERLAGQIGRITTAGVVTEYPTSAGTNVLQGITAGPDGALWFTEYAGEMVGQGNAIGRITTSGVVTAQYPLGTGGLDPESIVTGPDGALWFTEGYGNIGRITTSGVITEYSPLTGEGMPEGITVGPDGALWFGDGVNIGRITTAGSRTYYPLPGSLKYHRTALVNGITPGPNGTLWFTFGPYYVGQVAFPNASLTVSPASGPYQADLTFTGSGFAPNETVQVYSSGVGSAVLATGMADSSGSFTGSGQAPQSIYGPRLFLGMGQNSGKLGAANFSMTAGLVVSPTGGLPGTSITIQGYGFTPYAYIDVDWVNPFTDLGTPRSNADGSFSGNGTVNSAVPSGAPAGVNQVEGRTIRSTPSNPTGYGSFTVE